MSYLLEQAIALLEEATSYTSCETWSPSLTDEINSFVVNARAAKAATPAPAEPNQWRDLALKFDAQRMAAISHLRMMLQDPAAHADAVREFLSQPPSAALAATPAPSAEEQAAHDNAILEQGIQVGRTRERQLWEHRAATPAPAPLTLDAFDEHDLCNAWAGLPIEFFNPGPSFGAAIDAARAGQGKEASK